LIIDPNEYPPPGCPLRDWNPTSTSLTLPIPFVGACMDKSGILTGDLGFYDKAVEIVSGDLVLLQPKTADPLVDFFTKRLEAAGPDEHRPGKHQWWLGSDDGLFRLLPAHHVVVGRLVFVAHRRRDLPLPETIQREHDAMTSRTTDEHRADLKRRSLPALRAIERDGPDRTTVFRVAVPAGD
jgi:hypothetical protein